MNKAFTNFTWVDEPSETTPLSSENLNKINNGLNTVDDRVITLDTSVGTLNTSVGNLTTTVNGKEPKGKITVNGTEYTVVISPTDAGTNGCITFVVGS